MNSVVIQLPTPFYRPLLDQKSNIIGLPLTAQLLEIEGEIIIFSDSNTNDQFEAKVINVKSYYTKCSLTNFILDNGIYNISPHINSLESGIELYSKYWDIDKLQKDPTIALKIKRI
jgi:ASC-1-like (ASCH) protein